VRYRFLFEQMVRRELRQKYKGSTLGVLWYLINPLILMGAYALVFKVLLRVASVPDYPVFLISGLIVWVFFSQALLASAPSLVVNAPLIRKVRFPRETIPASVAAVQAFTFLVMLALLVPVALIVRGGGGTRSRVAALDDVSLRVAPGEAVGMVGRNGAGKTSTLRCRRRGARVDDLAQRVDERRHRVRPLEQVGDPLVRLRAGEVVHAQEDRRDEEPGQQQRRQHRLRVAVVRVQDRDAEREAEHQAEEPGGHHRQ